MMRVLSAVLLIALAALAPSAGRAGSASTSLSVNIVHPSAIQVVQGGSYGYDGGCYSSTGVTFSTPTSPGDIVVGSFATEDAWPCTNGSSADTVKVGSQQAQLLPRIQPGDFGFDNCCASAVPFILFNAAGGQTSFTITNSGGGNIDVMGIVTVITGFTSTASLDVPSRGTYYNNNQGTGSDALSSGTITPNQSGDVLYGFTNSQYGDISALSAGSGWTKGPNDLNINGDAKHPAMDEVILNYNSTNPVAATFGLTNASGEYAVGIIAIKP